MGTPLPEKSGPCPFSNFCWNTGVFKNPPEAPQFLEVSVSGVIIGDMWSPGDLDPPNGGYILTQINGTRWKGHTGIYAVTVILQDGFSEFTVTNDTPLPVFLFHQTGGSCPTSLDNEQVEPTTNRWIYGTMTIKGVS